MSLHLSNLFLVLGSINAANRLQHALYNIVITLFGFWPNGSINQKRFHHIMTNFSTSANYSAKGFNKTVLPRDNNQSFEVKQNVYFEFWNRIQSVKN